MWPVTALIVIALAVVGYFAYLLWSGWSETAGAPREDMYLCQKHGFIKKEHLIIFGEPMDVGTGVYDKEGKEILERKVISYCPLCFHSNMSAAERGGR